MDFRHDAAAKGSNLTKIAIVAALHLAVGAAVVNSMDSKMFAVPKMMEELVMITPEIPKPPPPPEPPPPEPPKAKIKPVTQPPKVHVPKVEVQVKQEPTVEAPLIAATDAPPPAEPYQPGPATPDAPPTPPAPPAPPEPPAPPAPPAKKSSKMMALANASDCATPEYPASAARNGETGTVSLALLIGVDGRVTDSKIQKSSGSRALDRAAQTALSLCKFKPATSDGEPEAGWGQIAYVWNLD